MSESKRRSVGRPRASKQHSALPARDDILAASAALFGEHGFKGTSTRMIADMVGIRQPSLFHHFPRKSAILEELLKVGAERLYRYLDQVDFDADPRVELYKVVAFDTHFLLTEPLGINKILALPEVRSGPLAANVEASQQRILGVYRQLISAGMDAGVFNPGDIDVVAYTVLGMEESVWSWRDDAATDIEASVFLIADMALRAVLVSTADLAEIKQISGPIPSI